MQTKLQQPPNTTNTIPTTPKGDMSNRHLHPLLLQPMPHIPVEKVEKMTTLKKLWNKFVKEFWEAQCCPYPCINFQDSDATWLDGAEAFYEYIKKEFTK